MIDPKDYAMMQRILGRFEVYALLMPQSDQEAYYDDLAALDGMIDKYYSKPVEPQRS